MLGLVLGGGAADVLALAAVVGEIAEAETPLGFTEITQRLLRGPVAVLGQRLEEVDHLGRRLVVFRRLDDLVAGCGKLHLRDVGRRAAIGVFSDSSRHAGNLGPKRGSGPASRWAGRRAAARDAGTRAATHLARAYTTRVVLIGKVRARARMRG